MKILNRIMDGVGRLAGRELTNIQTPASTLMQTRQLLWRQMYLNMSPWLVRGKVFSTNLACTASGEVARLVTLDMRSAVDTDAAVHEIYEREVLWNIRNQVEYGLAFGGMIIKPYFSAGMPRVTFAQPHEYDIISVDTDGSILECYFKDFEQTVVQGTVEYLCRVEHHIFDRANGTYSIINEVYRANGDMFGGVGNLGTKYGNTEKALRSVPRWAGIAVEQTLTGVHAPLFGFFKPATSNSIDTKSPHGVSIFDKAVPVIELADIQLSGLVREFKIKEGRLYVDKLALEGTDRRGEKIPHLADDFYIKMDVDPKQGTTFFEVFSPEIRSTDFLRVFNKYQQLVEDNIGLMHGTFSAPDITDRTATEVRESKHRTYSTVSSNQAALQKALQQAVNALAFYLGRPAPQVVTAFDDSLLRDPQEVLTGMADDVASGLIRPEIYLAKKYGMTEREALNMMPEGRQLLRGTNTMITWNEPETLLDTEGDGGLE